MYVNLSGKNLSLVIFLSFLCGTVVGYKLKSWRVTYLKRKKEIFANKLRLTQKQLDLATN
uniref:Cellular protein AbCp-37 n=1 Tax=Androctonus bicolor TaxID=748906 RepID=A0A0K0LC69_9SCOR|nr:cellular protein AbCp-37 [Androctonus bicolor]